MSRPLVSLIIPAHEPSVFLREAVKSVFCQRVRDLEVLVINDGPLPLNLEKHDDPRLKIIRGENPFSGPASARNLGIRMAKAKYLTFLDSDDRLCPESLTWRLHWLDETPEAPLVLGTIGEIIRDGRIPVASFKVPAFNPGTTRYLRPRDLVSRETCFPAVWLGLFRREVFNKIGFFDEQLRHREDLEFLIRVARVSPIPQVNLPCVDYRIHEGNFTNHLRLYLNRRLWAEDWLVRMTGRLS